MTIDLETASPADLRAEVERLQSDVDTLVEGRLQMLKALSDKEAELAEALAAERTSNG